MAWHDLERGAPEIARAGRRLLADDGGQPGVAFLATVDPDGRPRVHPFVPAIVANVLWAFIIASPKRDDLERTGAYAIHSRLGRDDESFFVGGWATRIDVESARTAAAAGMPYDGVDADHVLFEFGVDRALWTTWTTPTAPVHRAWST